MNVHHTIENTLYDSHRKKDIERSSKYGREAQTTNEREDKMSEEKKSTSRPKKSEWFVGIAQVRFKEQMEVIDYIMSNPYFKAIKILHTRDVYTIDDFQEGSEEGKVELDENGRPYLTVKMPDGNPERKYQGDKKPDHVHILVHIPKRQTAGGFNREFCKVLRFQVCESPEGTFRYMLHSDFKSVRLKKAKYSIDEIEGDTATITQLKEITTGACDLYDYAVRWSGYVSRCNGDVVKAHHMALADGQKDLIHQIASHGYYFKSFFENYSANSGERE